MQLNKEQLDYLSKKGFKESKNKPLLYYKNHKKTVIFVDARKEELKCYYRIISGEKESYWSECDRYLRMLSLMTGDQTRLM